MNQFKTIEYRMGLWKKLAEETGEPQIVASQKKPIIPMLPADSFDWSRWRAFTLFYDLNIPCRTQSLINNKVTLQQKAVGYCAGESLMCRPKFGTFAVMFEHNGIWQWCHISSLEFHAIFT